MGQNRCNMSSRALSFPLAEVVFNGGHRGQLTEHTFLSWNMCTLEAGPERVNYADCTVSEWVE